MPSYGAPKRLRRLGSGLRGRPCGGHEQSVMDLMHANRSLIMNARRDGLRPVLCLQAGRPSCLPPESPPSTRLLLKTAMTPHRDES